MTGVIINNPKLSRNPQTPLCRRRHDLPAIHEFCHRQLPRLNDIDAPKDAIKLGFHSEKHFDAYTQCPDLGTAYSRRNAAACRATVTLKEIFRMAIDFTKEWAKSDVALKTIDSEELLHANKTILAVHSPVFDTMFFGNFEEAKKDVVDIGLKYSVMLEVLKIVHHVDRQFVFTQGHRLYSSNMLAELYRAGDAYDIAVVQNLCDQQIPQLQIVEALGLALKLGFDTQKTEILKKMTYDEMNTFLNQEKKHSDVVFTANDVAIFFEKKIPKTPHQMVCKICQRPVSCRQCCGSVCC